MRDNGRSSFSKSKIKGINSLSKIISSRKKKGETAVFTNGCFDLLHYGHVYYLEKARQKGDFLIVAVNSDDSVRRIKGKNRPIVNEKDRAAVVAALECVDYVTIFNESTPLKAISILKPDILIKGADWKKKDIVGSDVVEGYGGKVLTIKYLDGYSTTGLIQKSSA